MSAPTATIASNDDASQLTTRVEHSDNFSSWEDAENALMDADDALHNRYQVLLEQYKRRCFEDLYRSASSDEQTVIREALDKHFGDTAAGDDE